MSEMRITSHEPTQPAPGTYTAPAATAAEAHAKAPTFTYDHALRAAPAWWRGALSIALLVLAYFVSSIVFGLLAVVADLALGSYTLDDLASGATLTMLTPAVMLANNLALASLWPLSMLIQWAMFGVRPRWLSSVEGRFRWRWMGRLALVIVPVWIVYVGISIATGPIDPIVLSGTVIAMVVVVLLTTPLQSAGEEFGARGLIQRSVGSWFRHPTAAFVVGTIVSGAVFATAHLAGDVWLIAYYFVFGASASLAARGTGGLEAPVLVHATNNLLLLLPTALMSQTDQVFERDAGTGGPFMLIPMALCLGAALFSTWWGRRAGITTRAPLPPTRADRKVAQVHTPPATVRG
ncbi:lysostaphin resistance A-like protein [Herbiconiux sp. P15]|uniref:CPBP family intramembrane glutamic endopeptidase n=1 Tax=Herbiconiux liukaitaii TaxID=3342799 RepID=UPI0035B6E1E0